MKNLKPLIQEIDKAQDQLDNMFQFQRWLAKEIKRRSQPFTPEVLVDYGFKFTPSNRNYLIEINGRYFSIRIDKRMVKIQESIDQFYFPLWKTIDDFENDLAKVMEDLK
jgi:hypothetical protein